MQEQLNRLVIDDTGPRILGGEQEFKNAKLFFIMVIVFLSPLLPFVNDVQEQPSTGTGLEQFGIEPVTVTSTVNRASSSWRIGAAGEGQGLIVEGANHSGLSQIQRPLRFGPILLPQCSFFLQIRKFESCHRND